METEELDSMRLAICSVCGNEVEAGSAACPFCQTEGGGNRPRPAGPMHRTVNLEKGMPLVQQALDRMELELAAGRKQEIKVLTLIHGYGSSGEGGAIKTAVLRQLQFLRHQGRIKEVIPGEEFEGRSGRGRQWLRRFPFLRDHRDLNRGNPGIILVLL
jgi:hypothetical protein